MASSATQSSSQTLLVLWLLLWYNQQSGTTYYGSPSTESIVIIVNIVMEYTAMIIQILKSLQIDIVITIYNYSNDYIYKHKNECIEWPLINTIYLG